jgi:hypothetical protein
VKKESTLEPVKPPDHSYGRRITVVVSVQVARVCGAACSKRDSGAVEELRRQRLQREAAERARSVAAVAISVAGRVSAVSSAHTDPTPTRTYNASFGNAPPRRVR